MVSSETLNLRECPVEIESFELATFLVLFEEHRFETSRSSVFHVEHVVSEFCCGLVARGTRSNLLDPGCFTCNAYGSEIASPSAIMAQLSIRRHFDLFSLRPANTSVTSAVWQSARATPIALIFGLRRGPGRQSTG